MLHKNPLSSSALFIISLGMLLTALPHLLRMPLTLGALIVSAVLIKLWVLRKGTMHVSKWILFPLGVTAFIFTIAHYGRFTGHEAGAALLVSILFLKLCESSTYRDGMISIFMAYFLTAINFLFTQSIPTALWMFVQVIVITFSLITLNQDQNPIPTSQKAKSALKIVFQAIPVMVVMFILFPRIPGPLWGIPDSNNTARTGFSETMSPGQFSNVISSGGMAFRVDFKGNSIPQEKDLYWRGLVLWYTDGRTWHRGKWTKSKAPEYQGEMTNALDYTIILEPHYNKTLFTLDTPITVSNAEYLDHNYLSFAKNDVQQIYQYSATSVLNFSRSYTLPKWERNKGTQLPEGYNPRTIEYGRQLRQRYSNDQDLVNYVLNKFRNEDYFYTLKPPLYGRDTVDEFLFDSQKGFCEHYSNAFVTLMRAANIPARVVVGYLGGEENPLDGTFNVRQADAHAWTEVWLEGKGWTRADPTAAVAPQRVLDSIEAALDEVGESNILPLLQRRDSVLKNMVNIWNAIDNTWNQFVLGYGPENQRKFLENFGLDDLYAFVKVMVGLLIIIMGIMSLFILAPFSRSTKTEAEKLFSALSKKLERKGYTKAPHQTALQYLTEVAHHNSNIEKLLIEYAKAYERIQYQRETEEDLGYLRKINRAKLSINQLDVE